MSRAGTYPLAADFGESSKSDFLETDPYWIMAVIRLGQPLSFNRRKMGSDSSDLSAGVALRAVKPLVITDDCLQLSVQMNKSAHTKTMNAHLKQTTVNYLVEVLPGDWVIAWMVNTRNDFEDLLRRIEDVATGKNTTESCNNFNDGFKFLGRIDDVYKDVVVDPNTGTKTSGYNVKCTGFKELDTFMYYDYALATSDAQGGNFGWMARFGVSVDALFGSDAAKGIQENNINNIIPILLDLVLGKGPDKKGNINISKGVSATVPLDAQVESSKKGANDPPYSYLVPISVGRLLGRESMSKGMMSYTDILELWTGVHSYSEKKGPRMFIPDFDTSSSTHRKITSGGPLLGTFLPFMPDFANRPLWGVLQQYVNHSINEIYTALKVSDDGLVVPTVVFRQIPFTTDALKLPTDSTDIAKQTDIPTVTNEPAFVNVDETEMKVTRFLDLPRWHISPTMVKRVHVGRSDATRTNFVHVYGHSTYLEKGGIPVQYQMIENPPIRDDVDVFSHGMRSYTTTVECWVDDAVGKAPGKWMALIADWMMGSHLTLNGTIECYGIQSPIAEGDNVLFDGVVYHVMGISHTAMIDTQLGIKHWTTTLQVTNGMRDQDDLVIASSDEDVALGLTPIYPGILGDDNTDLDPGLSVEHRGTSGGNTERTVTWDDPQVQTDRESEGTPLGQVNPNITEEQKGDRALVDEALDYQSPDASTYRGNSDSVGRR